RHRDRTSRTARRSQHPRPAGGARARYGLIVKRGTVDQVPRRSGHPQADSDVIQPAWAPDGTLSYVRDGAIWVGAGEQATQLTSGGGNDSSPAWRPLPRK